MFKQKSVSLLFVTAAIAFWATACFGSNPFITSIYTADPAAHVWPDGRLYVYASHDMESATGLQFDGPLSRLFDRGYAPLAG
jgi:hypothetical protein